MAVDPRIYNGPFTSQIYASVVPTLAANSAARMGHPAREAKKMLDELQDRECVN